MISFYTADIQYSLRDRTHLRQWLTEVARKEGFRLSELNIILCSDEYLYRLNVQYLNHKTYTDIITFDNGDGKGVVSGELYISLDRVRDNAKTLGISLKDELNRVMVHGLLHLCGYSDKSAGKKAEMVKAENKYLSSRGF